MDNFVISPEYCLIMKALRETTSLRDAAIKLQTDPAHLTRKLQKISESHDLVQKVGNKWVLTDSGRKLAQWVDESIVRQQSLLETKTTVNIAAFTWLVEEILIPGFHKLNKITNNKLSFRFNITAANLEDELISGRADFVITCHAPNDPQIAHKVFNDDPWYIVAPASWESALRKLSGEDLLKYLQKKPYIRLSTRNPEQILGFTPEVISDFMVDGVIGCRSAAVNGLGWTCIPGFSTKSQIKRKELIRVEVESASQGKLSIWWMRSRKDQLEHVRSLSKWLKEISS